MIGKEAGRIERNTHLPTTSHPSIFKTLPTKKTIEVDLPAEQGASAKIISR